MPSQEPPADSSGRPPPEDLDQLLHSALGLTTQFFHLFSGPTRPATDLPPSSPFSTMDGFFHTMFPRPDAPHGSLDRGNAWDQVDMQSPFAMFHQMLESMLDLPGGRNFPDAAASSPPALTGVQGSKALRSVILKPSALPATTSTDIQQSTTPSATPALPSHSSREPSMGLWSLFSDMLGSTGHSGGFTFSSSKTQTVVQNPDGTINQQTTTIDSDGRTTTSIVTMDQDGHVLNQKELPGASDLDGPAPRSSIFKPNPSSPRHSNHGSWPEEHISRANPFDQLFNLPLPNPSAFWELPEPQRPSKREYFSAITVQTYHRPDGSTETRRTIHHPDGTEDTTVTTNGPASQEQGRWPFSPLSSPSSAANKEHWWQAVLSRFWG